MGIPEHLLRLVYLNKLDFVCEALASHLRLLCTAGRLNYLWAWCGFRLLGLNWDEQFVWQSEHRIIRVSVNDAI